MLEINWSTIFIKIIIPEIISGAGLFEKAYEIEISRIESNSGTDSSAAGKNESIIAAEDINLIEMPEYEINGKATLVYYEALYHFRAIIPYYKEIIEYKYSDRPELLATYALIGQKAINESINMCCHCLTEISKRTIDPDPIDESSKHSTLTRYIDLRRQITGA